MDSVKKGVVCAVFSYVFWGIMPLYWRLLNFAGPLRILGCRITFGLIFTAVLLLCRGNRNWLRLLTDPGMCLRTIATGLLISLNWGIYIWAVNSGRTIEASLGYYVNPLASVVLGMIFLRERLGLLQWAAFGLAVLGVTAMTVLSGAFPWIPLGLAASFGLYGLFKKKNPGSAVETLAAETLAVLPLGLALLFFPPGNPGSASLPQWLLLAAAGPLTAIPLYAFARGAKSLPLSAMGFLQFINPTLLFLVGIFVFGEPLSPQKLPAFGCIWLGVILYCASLRASIRR